MAFRIQPHMRLHEWVADEAGFFRDEGLDYEFRTYRWMQDWNLVDPAQGGTECDEAVLV